MKQIAEQADSATPVRTNNIISLKKIIIAIDGYSSCGKSTLAKQLAARLGYHFIDTGAMYRAITLYFQRQQVDLKDAAAVAQALSEIKLSYQFNEQSQQSDILLNGENVAGLIRELNVANKVSEVAAIPAVRHIAVALQQQMGTEKGIVMDGRDVGTVVFPDAELKIFMTADTEVRVERRYAEMLPTHPGISREDVRRNLVERDHIDSTRTEGPLRQAADALVLDNSHLNREEQLALVLSWVNERSQ
jgi:cytidylate kinase